MSGTWSVVNNGMRIAIQFKTGNKYYWEDDLQGFSSGTWEGDAEYLTLYEQSFPIAKGAINSQGELKLNMQGGFYMTLKKQ